MTERELEIGADRQPQENGSINQQAIEAIPGVFRRHPRITGGILATLAIAGGVGYLIHELTEPEPPLQLAIGKTICPGGEALTGETTSSIDFDGQRFTFSVGVENIKDLVALTATTDGDISDIEVFNEDFRHRKANTDGQEILEIYDPKEQGAEDDEVLMSVWYQDQLAELVVSVPCE